MSGVVRFVVGIAVMVVSAVQGNLAGAKFGYYLAMSGLIEEAAKLFIPSVSKPGVRQDVEYSGTVEPRRIIYGTMRVGGLNTVRPIVTGGNGELLHQVLTLCGHQVSSIPTVYFNDVPIGDAAITAITGADSDGAITSGNYGPTGGNTIAWARRYLGTSTQTVDYKLHAARGGLWTTAHRGRGVAYLALTFRINQDKYASGKPEVSALVNGKLCYDPRLDSSPGANPTDPAYIAFTLNPALQLADYLTDPHLGRGIAPAKIDWTMVVAAANICDEDVAIPGPSTQKRYRSSMVLEASGDERIHEKNIKALASAMMGTCYRQGGKYRMYAGAALTPSFALSERGIVGNVSVRIGAPMGDAYNFVRGTFYDAVRNYQQVEFEPRSNATYEAADGDRFTKSIDLSGCTNNYEAQRNAEIVMKRSRMRTTLTAPFSLAAFKVRPWEVGTMSFADLEWVNQRVVCTSWRFVGDGTIEVSLQEDDAAIWTEPTAGQYSVPGSGSSGTSDSYVPPAVTAFAAKRVSDGIQFSWTLPDGLLTGDMVEIWEHTASTKPSPLESTATRVWRGSASAALVPKNDTTTRYYWCLVRAANGNASATSPASTGIAAGALSVSSVLSATPSVSSVSASGTSSSQTTAAVTVAPTGGTAPYTHAWVKISGDAITATSPSAASTTFGATGLASNETRTATFRHTVTDNLGATVTCDVVVEIVRAPMLVSLSVPSLYQSGVGFPSATITTGSVTGTPIGGVAPYSHAWSKVSGDTLTVNSPTSATTTFGSTVAAGSSKSAVYRLTVTDSTPGTPLTATKDINVTLDNLAEGP